MRALLVGALLLTAPTTVAFLPATPASAQMTTCQGNYGGGMNCMTHGASTTVVKPAAAIDPTLDTSGCPAFQRIAESCQQWAINKRIAKRKQIGALIVAGRCDDAFKAAMTEADFEFAKEVRALCTPPTQSAVAPTN